MRTTMKPSPYTVASLCGAVRQAFYGVPPRTYRVLEGGLHLRRGLGDDVLVHFHDRKDIQVRVGSYVQRGSVEMWSLDHGFQHRVRALVAECRPEWLESEASDAPF